jgi:hypothetical protein
MGGGETSAHKMKLLKRKENRRKALEKYIESSTKNINVMLGVEKRIDPVRGRLPNWNM